MNKGGGGRRKQGREGGREGGSGGGDKNWEGVRREGGMLSGD